jgi:hypothetical protein
VRSEAQVANGGHEWRASLAAKSPIPCQPTDVEKNFTYFLWKTYLDQYVISRFEAHKYNRKNVTLLSCPSNKEIHLSPSAATPLFLFGEIKLG